MHAKRLSLYLIMVWIGITNAGCALIRDGWEWHAHKKRANQAWTQFAAHNPQVADFRSYENGFKDGYATYLREGSAADSPSPPSRYRNVPPENVERFVIARRWFNGYQAGVAHAKYVAPAAPLGKIAPAIDKRISKDDIRDTSSRQIPELAAHKAKATTHAPKADLSFESPPPKKAIRNGMHSGDDHQATILPPQQFRPNEIFGEPIPATTPSNAEATGKTADMRQPTPNASPQYVTPSHLRLQEQAILGAPSPVRGVPKK